MKGMSKMREILFRGKRIDNREWENGYFADMGNKACIIKSYEPYWDESCKALRCRPSEIIPVDFSTVGQFTGLTDKNGKKIFDGDIIKITFPLSGDSVYLIYWDGENYRWGYDDLSGDPPYQWEPDISIEYIGNRWDNPELMEGKNG